jgi:hypothetical protein
VGRKTPVPLLARADHVEERVVHADGHPNQEHDGLDAVIERERLTDQVEQTESRRDCGQCEQDRNRCSDDRTECEQQHKESDGDRKDLRPMQVVGDDAVPRVTRRDVTGLLDRHPGVSRSGGEHEAAEGAEGIKVPDDPRHERCMAIR